MRVMPASVIIAPTHGIIAYLFEMLMADMLVAGRSSTSTMAWRCAHWTSLPAAGGLSEGLHQVCSPCTTHPDPSTAMSLQWIPYARFPCVPTSQPESEKPTLSLRLTLQALL